MKTFCKISLMLLAFGLCQKLHGSNVFSSCPQGDVNLSSQAAVDDFVAQYSDCTLIDGNLTIDGSTTVDLSGLSNLERINGNLVFQSLSALDSLSGLQNITSIGGNLIFWGTTSLTDLHGLNGQLQTIGGDLLFQSNANLANINALNGLQSIGGYLDISSNPALQSLSGLSQLQEVGGSFNIYDNDLLTNLTGIEQIQQIASSLTVHFNNTLTDCSALCALLANNVVGGVVSVYNNPSECNTLLEVQLLCQLTPCPTGDFHLTTQHEVDAFVQAYSTCSTLEGSLHISGNSATDLSGLSFLNSITGDLTLKNNNALDTLLGFENLSYLGGNLSIEHVSELSSLEGLNGQLLQTIDVLNIESNANLVDVDALNGLTKVNGYLQIRYNDALLDLDGLAQLEEVNGLLRISSNAALQSLVGLSKLQEINGSVTISDNPLLPNLNGMEQIQEIEGSLTIQNNNVLADCSAVCNLLANDVVQSSVFVSGNPSECNTLLEVQILCQLTPCPIGDFNLTTQHEVDAFVQAYSTCSTLEGSLRISGNNVTDLSGLSFLDTIAGDLILENNNILDTLTGLENLSELGGDLTIHSMNGLSSLGGLNGQALQTIGGDLSIQYNANLTDVDALNGLKTIGGYTNIIYNNALLNLGGLAQVEEANGSIVISYNPLLSSLNGIEQIREIEGSLTIQSNNVLTDCSAVCSLLANDVVQSSVYVSGNPSECSTLLEVQTLCQLTPCPIGDFYLTTQDEVDAFVQAYVACSTLEGNLRISSNNISDLSGLSFLDTITGNLMFQSNNSVDTLAGFENLSYLGGNLRIQSMSGLNSLAPLDGQALQTIGGYLHIQSNMNLADIDALNGLIIIREYINITYNNALLNLDGLAQLEEINGAATISYNPLLSNLNGIEQIQEIKGSLTIHGNNTLTDCSALCSLLANDVVESSISISGNPSECNTLLEVQTLCQLTPCPIGDFYLTTQFEVDAFVQTYAACSTLEGNLRIAGNDISDLSGLSFLEAITGDLILENSNTIDTLLGFENLGSLGGELKIYNMDGLSSLEPLNGAALQTVGDLYIQYNSDLIDIDDLSGLETICGNANIYNNPALTSIAGFSELFYIDGDLSIQLNGSLPGLAGMENIAFINGSLWINSNAALTDCSSLCLLLHAEAVANSISISGNPASCSNQSEVEATCTPGACTIGKLTLATQAELDDFVANQSSCDSLLGSIAIRGTVSDLSGLAFLKYLSGDLSFINNTELDSLSGFHQLELSGNLTINACNQLISLGGLSQISFDKNLTVYNNSMLSSLSGLDSLENLKGTLSITDNPSLADLSALANLQTVKGNCYLARNNAIASLAGLEQLNEVGGNLTISNHSNLTDCSAICTLLNTDGVKGSITISSNPSPCSSTTEVQFSCVSAGCPLTDITLTSQGEVDAFVAAYASCDSLPGDLSINGGSNITDISGLSFLTWISGDLKITSNSQLPSLDGLQGLRQVGGLLRINNNNLLDSISQLSQLDTIDGNLEIKNNRNLLNLDGLENISYVKGELAVSANDSLKNVAALSGLVMVEGNLVIYDNGHLQRLAGLENVNTVGGDLLIQYNNQLSDCAGVCLLINNGGVMGTINITGNPSECSSTNEVQFLCSQNQCPQGDIILYTQAELDAFIAAFSNCDSLPGDLTIQGAGSIDDLSNLKFIQYIHGDLIIDGNNLLTSLDGLDSLKEVRGAVAIRSNNYLTDIAALEKLTVIGNDLMIEYNDRLPDLNGLQGVASLDDDLILSYNDSLSSLAALENLISIEKQLYIYRNDNLPNLSGLENLAFLGGTLTIQQNDALTDCSVLCQLFDKNVFKGNITISGNPSECSTLTEVRLLCSETTCPTGDVTLNNQAEVDAFVATFPNCDSLAGNLKITGSNITDISGLSFLKIIRGYLEIRSSYLTDLTGLENLEEIGKELLLQSNSQLSSIAALGQLKKIGRDLIISGNNVLVDLTGLSQISHLDDNLTINNNNNLISLNGLNQLAAVEGRISIYSNAALNSIQALQQLSSAGGSLDIYANSDLTSLHGLQQLNRIGGSMSIYSNNALTDCSAICALINTNAIEGSIYISGNPSECSSITEVTTLCSTSDCPFGDVTLTTQNEVNAFVSAYINCDSLPGSLTISGYNDINNLSGLSFIRYVAGDVTIQNNHQITDLSGFENLQKTGGFLKIDNNRKLASLDQLAQLDTISGLLSVYNNDSLTTLTGLDQLAFISGNLSIRYNNNLMDCSGVCDLLNNSSIGGTIAISNNPSECSSVNEVQALCRYGSLISALSIENLPAQVEEGDSLTFDIAVDFAPSDTLWVSVLTSNAAEAPLLSPVAILPGETAVRIATLLPDDLIPEENELVTITAGATYLSSDSKSFELTNLDDIPSIELEILLDTLSEAAGFYATQGVVRRLGGNEGVLNITLDADQASELYLPAGLSIAAGQSEKAFTIGVFDNAQVDGFRTVDVSARVLMASCNCNAPENSAGVQNKPIVLVDDDGPALSLRANPLSLREGLAEAGTLTVRRNTPTDTALVVSLSSSDETELTLPSMATIPQGAAEIDILITTPTDMDADGSQIVSVQANAMGFSPGLIGLTVTDINKPDLQIAEVRLPETEIKTSDQFQFQVFIINTGFAAAPSGLSLKGYLSTNLLIDDADFLIGEYSLDAPIAVGDTIEATDLGNTPDQFGDYFLLFSINPEESITELIYLNNTSVAEPISILPNYFGSAVVEDSIFYQGENVPISGTSYKEGGAPAPDAALEIYIITDEIRRELRVTTDSEGQYTTVFEPFRGEAGYYTVGAAPPGQGSAKAQDSFDLVGVLLNNGDYIKWELLQNDTLADYLPIKNRSNRDLNDITITPLSLPNGCVLRFDTIPVLYAGVDTMINYQISGTELTSLSEYLIIPLEARSGETKIQEQNGYYFCQSKKGFLDAEISQINTAISQNNSRIYEFEIYNRGIGETGEVSINLPDVDWLKLKSPGVASSIEPGDTSLVILEFIPHESLPLNTPARGSFVIAAENGNSLNIPFTVEKKSGNVGNVIVDVIDQYTYFTDEAPHLAGAQVKISHYFTGEVFAEGTTDTAGLFTALDLPEGLLRLVVQAEKHAGYDGVIYVQPGITTEEVVFLEYRAISFSWNVVPTTVEDEYEVNLVMDFETNVPVPVVVIETPDTLPQLTDDETYPFFITLTNKGLITANELELSLPEDPEYEFVTNYTPQNLAAQQAIQVPVVMKRRQSEGFAGEASGNSLLKASRLLNAGALPAILKNNDGGNCRDVILTSYWYKCGDDGLYERTGALFTWEDRICDGGGGGTDGGVRFPVFPYYTSSGGSSGGGNPNNDGPIREDTEEEECCDDPIIIPPINIDCGCNSCLKNLGLAALGCLSGPIGTIASFIGCFVNPSLPGCGGAVIGSIPYKKLPLIGCIIGVLDAAINCNWEALLPSQQLKSLSTTGNFPAILQQPMDDIYIYVQAYEATENIGNEYYGALTENENIFDFATLVDPYLTGLEIIDMDARADIQSQMEEYDISEAEIDAFIDRWNTTVQAWDEGVFSPNATYPDIVDRNLLDTYYAEIQAAVDHAENRGFPDAETMIITAMEDIVALTKPSDDPNEETAFNPVCASVSIQISQRLTMTREAFEGTLVVNNGHPTDALQNLSLNLEILNESGVLSNDLFEIETTEVSVLTAIDGTGSLEAEQEGFAKVLFIPEPGAAPQTPQSYSFGGSISYLDPFSQLMVTMPLIPVTLQVNPSPDLFLHYFMDRDIYGDDPLTEPIEPIIPGELAVMIENNGYGDARNVIIESAQPEIIDNEKGLAVNFSLSGSKLQGEPANLGLTTIDFGAIPAQRTRIGQWFFTSDLLGHFTNYQTDLVHLDSRGNPALSLVSGVELHELIQSISVYGAQDDAIDDFLVNEVPDAEDAPDAIYLSQGNLVFDVFTAVSGEFSGDIRAPGHTTILEVDPLGQGWNYIKLDDPGEGEFEIVSITRNYDSRQIPLKNAWLTHLTIPDRQAPIYEDKFHFTDDFTSFDPLTYTVVWSPSDPNPPAVVSITGHPSELTSEQVTTLRIAFSEEINENTFDYEDLRLTFQGGDNIMDAGAIITKISPTVYEVDLSGLTTGNGFYVFTAQAAGVEDLTGVSGEVGKQISWTQFLSAPVVKQFLGLPENNIGTTFDTVALLFNLPIDVGTLTADRFSITKDSLPRSGTFTLEQLDAENKLFKLSGLGSFMSEDGEYRLSIDLPNIRSTDNVNGLTQQAITLRLDTQPPALVNLTQSSKGALDNQHYTGIILNFNEAINDLDLTALSLSKNASLLNIDSAELIKITDKWYELRWENLLCYSEGNYSFTIDKSQVSDLAGNFGAGVQNLNWIVNRSVNLAITNLGISPDLGYSGSDGVTSTKELSVSFDINEDAEDIKIYQRVNGKLNLLASLPGATAGSVTIPATFGSGGNTVFRVVLNDLFGNPVQVERGIYIDESALRGEWQFPSNQTLTAPPAELTVAFSTAVLDIGALPDGALVFSRNNNVLDVDNWTFTRLTDRTYSLSALDHLGSLPGVYKVGLDLSLFQKYSSGVPGNDFIEVSWLIPDTNEAPVAYAGVDTTLTQAGVYMLDASQSLDPEGEDLTYRWYPPAQIQLSDSSAINPSFMISANHPNEELVFLLSVSDGQKSSTDIVRVNIALEKGLLVSPIVYLQGAYDPVAGFMRDDLRTNELLPLGEPYTGLGYTQIGGGEEDALQTTFESGGLDAIVDWVFLELRDKSDSRLLIATRSALLQVDGDVVDVDGVSPVAFENLPEDAYYLVVKHRNHLGVMSAEPINLSKTTSIVDFTSDLNQTFGGGIGIAGLGDGYFGLYSGDFNHNGQVQNTDYNFMILTLGIAGYVSGDLDLNGQVQNTDLQLKLIPNIGKGQPFGQ